ncbi:MAG: NUDIX hydrolase [Chloroflexi bacterium]|nr:NUDIX hydrolase [Chloroflexota bacterium]
MSVPTAAPTDHLAYRFPVSVKGVILRGRQVLLLKNGRDEWELPGGKLEPDEEPRACLRREIEEELGLTVSVQSIIDTWVYRIIPGIDVLIVTYGCQADPAATPRHSEEHKAWGLFDLDDLDALPLPPGYAASIRSWAVAAPPSRTRPAGVIWSCRTAR